MIDGIEILNTILGVSSADAHLLTDKQGSPHEYLILTLVDGRRIQINAGSSDHWVDIELWVEELDPDATVQP